jgi:hypothetical protein
MNRLERLLTDFEFGSVSDVMNAIEFDASPVRV